MHTHRRLRNPKRLRCQSRFSMRCVGKSSDKGGCVDSDGATCG